MTIGGKVLVTILKATPAPILSIYYLTEYLQYFGSVIIGHWKFQDTLFRMHHFNQNCICLGKISWKQLTQIKRKLISRNFWKNSWKWTFVISTLYALLLVTKFFGALRLYSLTLISWIYPPTTNSGPEFQIRFLPISYIIAVVSLVCFFRKLLFSNSTDLSQFNDKKMFYLNFAQWCSSSSSLMERHQHVSVCNLIHL